MWFTEARYQVFCSDKTDPRLTLSANTHASSKIYSLPGQYLILICQFVCWFSSFCRAGPSRRINSFSELYYHKFSTLLCSKTFFFALVYVLFLFATFFECWWTSRRRGVRNANSCGLPLFINQSDESVWMLNGIHNSLRTSTATLHLAFTWNPLCKLSWRKKSQLVFWKPRWL